ncbi:MAG TPA: Asd/ArgC dimerization domain-containing protein [Candidatus Polarisedimenticolia bacterium]|nr:Asd/ArgC dimerization domain-containing protein [Candidatus Polarisedimenticolia bacterium]
MGDDGMTAVGTGRRIAFFGSNSLLAREIRGVLESRSFPATDVRLYDEQGEGTISDYAGEALVVTRPDEESLAGLDIAFLCGSAADMAPYLDWPARGGFTAIDLSGASSARPDVPLVHTEINAGAIAPAGRPAPPLIAAPHAVAHNAATLAAAARSVGRLSAVDVVALRPASELGERGIDELQRQTIGLLNFTETPREVFGRQAAFNVLPSAGVASSRAEGFDERARGELGRLLGADTMERLSLASAFVPVFHGHTLHVSLTFASPAQPSDLAAELAQARGIRLVEDLQDFSPVDLAGEEAVAVAGLALDPGRPERIGLWAFCDNLRGGSALNAIRIAERVADLLPERRS